jgi:hypothetical protein
LFRLSDEGSYQNKLNISKCWINRNLISIEGVGFVNHSGKLEKSLSESDETENTDLK